jgi:hypothetical protein
MKTIIHVLSFFSLPILWACPYSSIYKLDDQPVQYIDDSLLGKWTAMVTKPSDDQHPIEEPVKIVFSKKSDMEYNVAITGCIHELACSGVMLGDSIKGTAFLSIVANREVLNILIQNQFYLAEVQREDGKLSILSMSEHFTNKFIKNNAELRNALEFHFKTRLYPSYDDYFVLKDLQHTN